MWSVRVTWYQEWQRFKPFKSFPVPTGKKDYARVSTRAHACGRGRSGKEHGRVLLRAIPCICAPVNMNLLLITGDLCPYVLFAGLTLTKRPAADFTKLVRNLRHVIKLRHTNVAQLRHFLKFDFTKLVLAAQHPIIA